MTSRIPLFARERSLDATKPQILNRIKSIMESSSYIQGEDVAAFEQEFAEYVGCDHCVGLANGTDALMIGLTALGVRPGDEVVVPSITFFATAEAVAAIGAKPVFADVEPGTWVLSPRTVEPVLSGATAAIIPVHLFGNLAPLDGLIDLARSCDVPLLEDAAQAAGAVYQGRKAGSFGEAASFSFYPGKNLGAIGDAGALVTNDPEVANLARLLREHGSKDRRIHTEVGYNSRLDSIQAAALRVSLPYLDGWTDSRRQIANLYRDLGLGEIVALPEETQGGRSCFHQYVVTSNRRDELQAGLEDSGVESRIYYSPSIPSQPAMKKYASSRRLPTASDYEKTALAIPMGESLGATRAQLVVDVIRETLI